MTIGEAAVRYMREQMAMADVEEDQEQNWILGHLMTFAQQVVEGDRIGDVELGPVREYPTRAVKTRPHQ